MWKKLIAWLKNIFASKKQEEILAEEQVSEPTKGIKRALLVGINKYQESGNDLSGCVNDAEDMYDLLVNKFGFERDNIRVLTDERATKENIKNRLTWLVSETKKDDTAVYYHSGHGCFTGDTKIRLLDGTEKSFEELVLYHSKEKFYVYSLDHEGNVVAGLAHSPRMTKKARIMEVELDTGEKVRCTSDHLFMLNDGSYKQAGDLCPQDSLMPLYVTLSDETFDKRRVGYEMVRSNQMVWKFTHEVVAPEKEGFCEICRKSLNDGKHTIKHHRNGNKEDNRPTNIQWVTVREHRHIHFKMAELSRENGFGKIGLTNDNEGMNKKRAKTKKRKAAKDKKYAERVFGNLERIKSIPSLERKRLLALRRSMKTRNNSKALQKARLDNLEKVRMSQKLQSWYESDALKEVALGNVSKMRKELENARKANPTKFKEIGIAALQSVPKNLGNHNRWHKGVPYESCPACHSKNHKVKSVVFTDIVRPVYDITVEKYHNFALAAGVFVHNSQVRDRDGDELNDQLDECLCVSGDMLITTDCGLVQAHRLYDVLQSGEQVKAKVGDEWHNIIASARTEKDRVVSICLQNGLYLTLGEEHKVFVFDNGRMIERKASEISVDDYLLFPCGPWKGNKDIDLTWYLVGLFVGDGCFVTESTVRFSVRRYKDFWRDVAIQAEKCHSLDAKVKVLENKRGDLNVTIRSRLFSSLLRGLGFKPKQRKMGHILELPIPMNEGCVKGFLRGLFDSDGSSSARQVTFYSTDYELCKLVTVLIGFFGVRGQISRRVVKNTRAHIGYTVGIYGFSAQLFLERIGFGIKEKAEKFKPNVYSRHGDAGRLSISELHNLLERWNFKFCDFSAALGIHKRNLRRTKTCQFTREMALASVEFLGKKVKKADNLLMMKNAKVIENRKDIDASIEQIENCCGVNRYTAYSRLKKGNVSDVRNYAELMKKDVSSFLERDWDILKNYDVVRVSEIKIVETPIEMFDFTVENVEKFEVNGVLVHNCTYDFSWDDPFTDDEVAEILKPLVEGAYLNIIIDTCHSGSMTRSFENEGLKDNKIKSIRPPFDIHARIEGREAIRVRRFGAKFKSPETQRHVLLSGCKDNEFSEETSIDNKVRGALTYFVTKILRDQSVKDWKELHTKILADLQNSGFSQHPQLTGMESLLSMKPLE